MCLCRISDLQGRKVMVNQESQSTDRDDQELHSERVMVPIISRLELQVDEVHSGVCTSNVDDLEDTQEAVTSVKVEHSIVCAGLT